MSARTAALLLVPLAAALFWLASRDGADDASAPSTAANLGETSRPPVISDAAPLTGGAEPRPSLALPALEDAGARVAAGRRVGIRPISEVREEMRRSAGELVTRLETIRVEARLTDEQWEALLQDLLEAAIERRVSKRFILNDALGQQMTESDRVAAYDAGIDELQARVASYLTPRQIATFRLRLGFRAAIGWVENTDVLRDADQPDLRLYPNVDEPGLADL